MAKILEATCVAGVVKVGTLAIPSAIIGSEGVASSTGVLLIEGDKAWYFAKTSADLKATLEQAISALEDVSQALTQIGTSLTSIGAGMTGPTTAPPPSLAADVTIIVNKAAEITAARVALNTLKGGLR